MAQTIQQRLETLKKRNSDNNSAINKDLYRILVRKDFLNACYQSIKSKAGNMILVKDNVTLDRYSEKVVDTVILALKDQSWKFKPVQKRDIPNGSSKWQSVRISDIQDQIVQNGIEMILSSIYEPSFSYSNYGFRICRSCHSALKSIKTSWSGIKWVIEGDIEGYDSLMYHSILIRILRRKIQDERFLNLIWKFLRSGSEQERNLKLSKKGLSQRRVVLTILTNIYLHELDIFIETLINQYDIGKQQTNKKYGNLLRELNSEEFLDKNLKKLVYLRYEDDWILGIIGSKNFAETIYESIQRFFLEHLKLTISPKKNHILHFSRQGANFLGYYIKCQQAGIYSKSSKAKYLFGATNKTICCKPSLLVPMDLVIKGLSENNFCTKLGFPLKKKGWIVYDDKVIIYRYNSVLQKLTDYYAFADNLRTSIKRINFILKYSCAHTLAAKHRTRISKQFSRKDFKSIKVLWNGFRSKGNRFDFQVEKENKMSLEKAFS